MLKLKQGRDYMNCQLIRSVFVVMCSAIVLNGCTNNQSFSSDGDTNNSGDCCAKPDSSDSVDFDIFTKPDTDIVCTMDSDCTHPDICVQAKCIPGCQNDTDCSAYSGTKCNTKLGRCLNVLATEQACSELNCPTGCCIASEGFTALKCETAVSRQKCGICKQGEVFMNAKTCVPAACSLSDFQFCQDYNANSSWKICFECKVSELVCYENWISCEFTSAYKTFNAASCRPAGESCTPDDTCCSGQPCIQGYCY